MYEPISVASTSQLSYHFMLKSPKIAQSFEKYFRKLTDMLERIGDVLPRCQVYQNLFSINSKLLQAISIAYIDVIHFCWTAKKAFRKMKKSTTSNAHSYSFSFQDALTLFQFT